MNDFAASSDLAASGGYGPSGEALQGNNVFQSLDRAYNLELGSGRRLHSATHEEILTGATADIYWVKTMKILHHTGRAHTRVGAEVFAGRPGVFAGIQEVAGLLNEAAGGEGGPVEVWALPEGSRFEAREPLVQIRGPYSAFGPHETALLGMLASASGWATAAARVREAAGDALVISFGARHVHPAVAPVMERAAVLGGCDGASCILGAALAGRKPMGTIPHACILITGDTVEVARTYDEIMPDGESRTILVDTFHDEAEETLRLARALGPALHGIRLDTPGERGGVTPGLVREVRARLDLEGFKDVSIFCSGGLNPDRIVALREAGADGFGVGSFISGARAIDMTMDIKEIEGRPVAKRGRIPGLSQSSRLVPLGG